jgi:hypothetical protein
MSKLAFCKITVIWEIKTLTLEDKLVQFTGALVVVLGLVGVVLGAAEDVLPPLVVEPALLAVVDELHGDGVVLAVVVAVVEAPHELAALRRASKRLQLLLLSSEIVLAIVSSANEIATL